MSMGRYFLANIMKHNDNYISCFIKSLLKYNNQLRYFIVPAFVGINMYTGYDFCSYRYDNKDDVLYGLIQGYYIKLYDNFTKTEVYNAYKN